jgi:hypothetical protein
MTTFNIDAEDSFLGDYLFNKFKKHTAVVVYIQKASFTSLGYLIETEQQRQLTKIIAEGGRGQSDSPESQLDLHHWLFDYLNTHAQVVGLNEMAQYHNQNVTFITKSGGTIEMDLSLGWSEISADEKGTNYLKNLLEEKGYSINTTETAYGG